MKYRTGTLCNQTACEMVQALNKPNLPPLPSTRQYPAYPFWMPTHANKKYDHYTFCPSSHQPGCPPTLFFSLPACLFFFFWVVLQLRPPAGTWQTTKKRGERAQAKEQAKGSCSRRPRTKERKPGKRKKKSSRVQSWGSAGQKTQKKTRRMEGDAKHTKKKGGETHIVAVVETRAASIEARQREANTAEEPCWRAATNG